MNEFETLGQLDAAEVFSQEDFDPTPEDLGRCSYGDDTAVSYTHLRAHET